MNVTRENRVTDMNRENYVCLHLWGNELLQAAICVFNMFSAVLATAFQGNLLRRNFLKQRINNFYLCIKVNCWGFSAR